MSLNWIKKNWGNILWGVFFVLILIPQTGTPIKVFINRLLAFSPSIEAQDDREILQDYDWLLRDMGGHTINLKDYKGKKIIINFWATWCPPCIAEMPSMQALYDDFGEETIFFFVTNDDKSAVEKFIKKHDYDFPIYQSLGQRPKALEGNSLPTTFLIDNNGGVLIHKVGSANWNSENVRALLE
ncbi:MAG: thiol-disulfide isomerase/thioredoxin [Arcticibacterium sp.]|jgi:thiol-disulfide isomerase/thioredoxin